ncbi:MAG: hypothetical protein ACJ0OL_01030 [Dehalococcoidia bacterium]|mgnify:CR=1 FL=1
MTKQKADELLSAMEDNLRQIRELAANLSDEALDGRVQGYGGRDTAIRNILYAVANHSREHVNHIQKILRPGSPSGSTPSEAQLILGQAEEAIARLKATVLPVTDSEWEKSLEDYTVIDVLQHLTDTQKSYIGYLTEGLK